MDYFLAESKPCRIDPDMPQNITIKVTNRSNDEVDIVKIHQNGKFIYWKSIGFDEHCVIDTYIGDMVLQCERVFVKNEYVEFTDETGSYKVLNEIPKHSQFAYYVPPNSLEIDQRISLKISNNLNYVPNSHMEKFLVKINNHQVDCTRIINGFERSNRFLILELLLEANEIINDYAVCDRYNQSPESKLIVESPVSKLEVIDEQSTPGQNKSERKISSFVYEEEKPKKEQKCCKCDHEAFLKFMQAKFHTQNQRSEHSGGFTGTRTLKRNTCLHWTIYNADFASSYLVFMMNPHLILYQNEGNFIPFDMALLFFYNQNNNSDGSGLKKYNDIIWIIENIIEESICKVPESVYGVDSWFEVLESYIISNYYKPQDGKHDPTKITTLLKSFRSNFYEKEDPEISDMEDFDNYDFNVCLKKNINFVDKNFDNKKSIQSYSQSDFDEIKPEELDIQLSSMNKHFISKPLTKVTIKDEPIQTPDYSFESTDSYKHFQLEKTNMFQITKKPNQKDDDEEDKRIKHVELKNNLGHVAAKICENPLDQDPNKILLDIGDYLKPRVNTKKETEEKMSEKINESIKILDNSKKSHKKKCSNNEILEHILSEIQFDMCKFQQKLKDSSLTGSGIFCSKWGDGQNLASRLEKIQTEKRKTAKYVSKKRRNKINAYLKKLGQPDNVQITSQNSQQIKAQKLHQQDFGLTHTVMNHDINIKKMDVAESFLNKFFFWLVAREFYVQSLIFMDDYGCSPFINITDNINTFMYSMKCGNKVLAKFLIEQQYFCRDTNKRLETQELIKYSSHLDYNTPLHFAMINRNYRCAIYLMKIFNYEDRRRKISLKEDEQALKKKVENTTEHTFDTTSVKWKKYIPSKKIKFLEINEMVNLRGVKPLYENNLSDAYKDLQALYIKNVDKAKKVQDKLTIQMDKIYDNQLISADFPELWTELRTDLNKILKKWLYCIISVTSEKTMNDDIINKQLLNIKQKYKDHGNFEYMRLMVYNNSPDDPCSGKNDQRECCWLQNIDDNLAYHFVTKLGLKLYNPKKRLSKEKHQSENILDFEQLRDWIRIEIILHLLQEEFSLDEFMLSGIIKEHFTMHNFDARRMLIKYWKKYWRNLMLLSTPFSDQNSYAPINLCALYYGVQVAYYIAFTIVIITWLQPICFYAIVQTIINVFTGELNNAGQVFYNQFISIWSLVLYRLWTRIESNLSFVWDMDGLSKKKLLKTFRGYYSIDKKTTEIKKRAPQNSILRRLIIDLLLFSFGIFLIVITFILSVHAATTIDRDYQENRTEYYMLSLMSGSMNGVLVFIGEMIYNFIQTWALYLENHEYQSHLQTSHIVKSFIFQFTNCYVTLFYYAFVKKSFSLVSGNQLSLVLTKQGLTIVKMNLLPWLKYRYNEKIFLLQWKTMRLNYKNNILATRIPDYQNKMYEKLSKRDKKHLIFLEIELAILYEVQLNKIQAPARNLEKEYEIACIIVGYIAFYSSFFPMTSLITLGMVFVKFGFDTLEHVYYAKRSDLEPQRGIIIWNKILKTICYSSITYNACIIFFTTKGLDKLQGIYKDEYETERRNLFILVITEHLIIWVNGLIKIIQPNDQKSIRTLKEKMHISQHLDKIQLRDNLAREHLNLEDLKEQNKALKNVTNEAYEKINMMKDFISNNFKHSDDESDSPDKNYKDSFQEQSFLELKNNLLDNCYYNFKGAKKVLRTEQRKVGRITPTTPIINNLLNKVVPDITKSVIPNDWSDIKDNGIIEKNSKLLGMTVSKFNTDSKNSPEIKNKTLVSWWNTPTD